MNLKSLLGWSSALCLGTAWLQCQVQAQDTNEIEQLRKQIKQANEAFQKAGEQYRQTLEELNKKLDALQGKAGPTPAAPATTPPAVPDSATAKPWSPTDPIRVVGGQQNYLNLSFDALFAAGSSTAEDVEALQLGGHDPRQRGFTV